jgi:hypothetical protein
MIKALMNLDPLVRSGHFGRHTTTTPQESERHLSYWLVFSTAHAAFMESPLHVVLQLEPTQAK